jgi:dienelactone hydrolase
MADVVLFHHYYGQTPGFFAFADELRRAGHVVHTPDMYDGVVLTTVEDAVAHERAIGNGRVIGRAVEAAMTLPERVVYAGFGAGVLPAQWLAQTRPGALGALLFSSCVPEFGDGWPSRVPVQIHAMQDDRVFVDDGDADAAHALVNAADHGELYLYPGDRRHFADSSLPDHDPEAAALLMQRVLAFLARI